MNLFSLYSQTQISRLPVGYILSSTTNLKADELNELLISCGEPPRPLNRIKQVLANSLWYINVRNEEGHLIGFVRATSDKALNSNLWDLVASPTLSNAELVLEALAQEAMIRLKQEFPSCSISLAAPPEALKSLQRIGFLVDPDGIRAMGRTLQRSIDL